MKAEKEKVNIATRGRGGKSEVNENEGVICN